MTRFRFKVKGGYVIGALDIPTDVGSVCVAAVGGSKAEALMRAATIAQRISEDPVMAALMPPQATAAIAAAKALSVAAKRGPAALKSLWSRIKGPGKQRLAAALHEEATQESGYFGKRSSVRQPNRGAWQSWQDPYYGDEHDDDDDAESYDADAYPDIDLEGVGRRRRRSKRSYRPREADERDSEPDPDAPIDEPEAQGTERTGAVDGDE
jgi:hypothetical protein